MPREFVRIEGLAGVLDVLKALPPEIVSKAGGPVKAALKKAAELLRDEAKANLRAIISQPNADAEHQESTGLLLDNVVAGRSRPPRGQRGERYAVRVRKKAYKVSSGAKPVVTPQVARLLESGTAKRRPMPWMRPAFDVKKVEATQVFATELRRRVDVVIKRLERKARRK